MCKWKRRREWNENSDFTGIQQNSHLDVLVSLVLYSFVILNSSSFRPLVHNSGNHLGFFWRRIWTPIFSTLRCINPPSCLSPWPHSPWTHHSSPPWFFSFHQTFRQRLRHSMGAGEGGAPGGQGEELPVNVHRKGLFISCTRTMTSTLRVTRGDGCHTFGPEVGSVSDLLRRDTSYW